MAMRFVKNVYSSFILMPINLATIDLLIITYVLVSLIYKCIFVKGFPYQISLLHAYELQLLNVGILSLQM